MLTDRPEFKAWLARHEADHIRFGRDMSRTGCDSCGAEGEPYGQESGYCLLCLAVRFGGDQVEADLTKLFVGGVVKAALRSDVISDELAMRVAQDAIREYEHDQGMSWGRGLEREAVAR